MLLEALGGARDGKPATRAQVERVHDAGYLEQLASLERETWLDGDTIAGPSSCSTSPTCGWQPTRSNRKSDGAGLERIEGRAAQLVQSACLTSAPQVAEIPRTQ